MCAAARAHTNNPYAREAAEWANQGGRTVEIQRLIAVVPCGGRCGSQVPWAMDARLTSRLPTCCRPTVAHVVASIIGRLGFALKLAVKGKAHEGRDVISRNPLVDPVRGRSAVVFYAGHARDEPIDYPRGFPKAGRDGNFINNGTGKN